LCLRKIFYGRNLTNQPQFLENIFHSQHDIIEEYVLRQHHAKRQGKGRVIYCCNICRIALAFLNPGTSHIVKLILGNYKQSREIQDLYNAKQKQQSEVWGGGGRDNQQTVKDRKVI